LLKFKTLIEAQRLQTAHVLPLRPICQFIHCKKVL